MCVYNVTVLSILGVVLLFALGQQVELQYALVSAFIIFGTSIVQLTIFIPKVMWQNMSYTSIVQIRISHQSVQTNVLSAILIYNRTS